MAPPKRHKVLVIDDDKAITTMVAGILRSAGYTALMAFDPIQAFRLAQQEAPSLILLDLQMPAGGGVQTLDRLLGSVKTHQIPVVILTASPAREREAELRARGAVGYLEKPIDADRLLELVRDALEAAT